MNQIEWGVPSNSILCGVDGKCKPLSILIPVSLVNFSDVHLERVRQGLHHSLGCSICLWSVSHGSTLFLSYDPAEGSKEVGHKSRFSIVPDSLASPEASKHTFFVILRYCLCRS